MNEILVSMDLSGTTQNIVQIGLLLGHYLKAPINIVVGGNKSNSFELEELGDKKKLNYIKENLENEAKSLKLKKPVGNKISFYQIPNCDTSKKVELMRDFINDHNISYFVSSIKQDKPLPFQNQQDKTQEQTIDEILHDLSCPTILVNTKFNSIKINDIGVFFSNLKEADRGDFSNLKAVAETFNAKMHLMAIIQPDSTENSKIISLLKGIADKFEFKNYSLNTVINNNMVEGINFFSQKRILDMIVISGNNSNSLFEEEDLNELIKEEMCPVFCYWPS